MCNSRVKKGKTPTRSKGDGVCVDLASAHNGASASEETKTSLSMGVNESKSHSKRKETTSKGLLGRGRHTEVSSIKLSGQLAPDD